MVKKVGAVYEWKVGSESWILDLKVPKKKTRTHHIHFFSPSFLILQKKNGNGAVRKGGDGTKADCTLTMAENVFADLMGGKLNAQQAFMQGKLKIGGELGLLFACLF